jgi:hypothetical protein
VREDGRLVGGEGWKEWIYNREEWKKLLRTERNHLILHMPMERMNKWMNEWMNKWMNEWVNEYLQTSIQNIVVEWLEYCFKLWTLKGQISTRRPVFISAWANYQDKTASFHIPYDLLFTYNPPATENLPNKRRI